MPNLLTYLIKQHFNILILLSSILLALISCDQRPKVDIVNVSQNPVRVQIKLSLRIGSCGFNAQEYNTSCLKALVLILRGEKGQQKACKRIDSPLNNRDFVSRGFADVALGTFPFQGKVVAELRGLHNKGLAEDFDLETLCEQSNDKKRWLLWGKSKEFDLEQIAKNDLDFVSIDIPIECRDCAGGCENYGAGTCALNPSSFCVPGQKKLTCDKICTDDSNCYEGHLSCDLSTKRCDKSTATLGEFCASCRSNSDCDTESGYFCVGRIQAEEGICAHACLDSNFDNYCESGSSCRRIGKDIWPVPLN